VWVVQEPPQGTKEIIIIIIIINLKQIDASRVTTHNDSDLYRRSYLHIFICVHP
jgi:hypothetical protein